MLGALRRNKNNPIITFVLGLIVLLMMAFGISVNSVSGGGYAAKVNGEEITDREFAAAYSQAYRNKQYQNPRYDRKVAEDEKLRETVLDEMVAGKLLAQRAQKLGLAVDDDALRDAIVEDERYYTDGAFDRDLYERWVNGSGMSEMAYEAAQREALLAGALTGPIETLGVSEAELKQSWIWDNTKVDIDAVQVFKEEFAGQVGEVTEKDVAEFKAREDADEKIQAYYAKNKSTKYDVPKKVCAQHILIRADDSTPPDARGAAQKTLQAAAKAIADGMDFSAAAKRYSEDANKDKGGDLGCFAAGETQPQLAEAAFGLKPGEVSKVVKTPFGYHLVKVNEIKEPVRKKLEDVKDEIAKVLAKETAAGNVAKKKAEELAAMAKDKGSLQAVVDEVKETWPHEIKVQDTGPFTEGRTFLPKLGNAPEVSKAAWKLTEEAPIAGPFETDRAWVVIALKSKEAPDEADFEKQKVQVAYPMIRAKQKALRDKWYARLQDGAQVDIDPIAVSYSDEAENIRSQRRQRR